MDSSVGNWECSFRVHFTPQVALQVGPSSSLTQSAVCCFMFDHGLPGPPSQGWTGHGHGLQPPSLSTAALLMAGLGEPTPLPPLQASRAALVEGLSPPSCSLPRGPYVFASAPGILAASVSLAVVAPSSESLPASVLSCAHLCTLCGGASEGPGPGLGGPSLASCTIGWCTGKKSCHWTLRQGFTGKSFIWEGARRC